MQLLKKVVHMLVHAAAPNSTLYVQALQKFSFLRNFKARKLKRPIIQRLTKWKGTANKLALKIVCCPCLFISNQNQKIKRANTRHILQHKEYWESTSKWGFNFVYCYLNILILRLHIRYIVYISTGCIICPYTYVPRHLFLNTLSESHMYFTQQKKS